MDMLTAFIILIKQNASNASSLLLHHCTFLIVYNSSCNHRISVLLSDSAVNENVRHVHFLHTVNGGFVLTQGRNKGTYYALIGKASA